MKGHRRPKFGSGEIIILIAILLLLMIIITGNFQLIVQSLYSSYAVFVAVVMIVEYLLLKGADRSELYRRELDAAREKRRDDVLTMRAMEVELVELRARLNTLADKPQDPDGQKDALDLARHAADKLLELLRARI